MTEDLSTVTSGFEDDAPTEEVDEAGIVQTQTSLIDDPEETDE